MPPPKKPKTGASRVAEFLSQRELDELSSRTSGSPHSMVESEGSPFPSSPNQEPLQRCVGDGSSTRSLENIQQTGSFSREGSFTQNSSLFNDKSTKENSAILKVLESQKPEEKNPLFRCLFMQAPESVSENDSQEQNLVKNPDREKKGLVQSLLTADDMKSNRSDSEDGSILKHLMKKESLSFKHLASNKSIQRKEKEENLEQRNHKYNGDQFARNNLTDMVKESSGGRSEFFNHKPAKSYDLSMNVSSSSTPKVSFMCKDKFKNGQRPDKYYSSPIMEKVETGTLNIGRYPQFQPYGSPSEYDMHKPTTTSQEIPQTSHYEPRPGMSSSRKEYLLEAPVGRDEFNHSKQNYMHLNKSYGKVATNGSLDQKSQTRHSQDRLELSEMGNEGSNPLLSKAYMNAVCCMEAMSSDRPQTSTPSMTPQPTSFVAGSSSVPNIPPSDLLARHSTRAQQDCLRRMPLAVQQEALKNPNSAAALALITAMRNDASLGQRVDQNAPTSSEVSRDSPDSQQPLPPGGLSRNQITMMQQHQAAGQFSTRAMEQSPPVVSSDNTAQRSASGRDPTGAPHMAAWLDLDEQRLGGGVNPVGSSNVAPSPEPLNSPQEMPSSTMDDRRGRARSMAVEEAKAGGKRCQICDDTASGFHYGVWSCEGCKAFFKRSLQGPVDYVCPATNNCTIDKHRRKSCQACRLRKCLESGMSRGNCRKEKAPRAINKKRKSESMECSSTELKQTKIKKEADDSYPQSDVHRTPLTGGVAQQSSVRPGFSQPPSGQERESPPPIHPFVEHLMRIDPPVRFANHDNQATDSQLNLLTSMLKLADAELVDIINWAKAIPGYNGLSLDDRIHLLESSWMELLILGLLWRSIPYNDTLVFAPDLPMTRDRCKIADVFTTCEKLFAMVDRFRELKITREELVLIRITLLLNAEMIALQSNEEIRRILEMVNEAWHYTIVTRNRHSPTRLTQIMLMLPHFRQCSLGAVAHIFELKRTSSVPIYDLLREMLEGQREVQSTRHTSADIGRHFGLLQANNTEFSDITASNQNNNPR